MEGIDDVVGQDSAVRGRSVGKDKSSSVQRLGSVCYMATGPSCQNRSPELESAGLDLRVLVKEEAVEDDLGIERAIHMALEFGVRQKSSQRIDGIAGKYGTTGDQK